MSSPVGDLFGRGLAFDIGLDPSGSFAWSEGPDNISQSIRLILMTEPGERLMRPTFGAGLRRFLSEPNVPATHRIMEERIGDALRRCESRIKVLAIDIETSAAEPASALVTISYELVATGETGRLRLAVPTAQGA